MPRSPRGVTESCTGCVLPPMALMAWHSYCPWSCRATRPTRRVPVDSTLCRLSLGKGPPGRRSSSSIRFDSPHPIDAKGIFDFARPSQLFAALEGVAVLSDSFLTPAVCLLGKFLISEILILLLMAIKDKTPSQDSFPRHFLTY